MTVNNSNTQQIDRAAAAWLQTVTVVSLGLHSGANGSACRCGQCRHRIVVAARVHRVPANLVAARVWKPVAPKAAAPARRRPLTGSIATVGTIVVDGRQLTGAEGIVALSQRGTASGRRDEG